MAFGLQKMRDNHDQLPELLKAYKRGDDCFAAIGCTIEGKTRAYEIGLTPQEFTAISKMLSLRPFDNTPGLKYRYFFVPSITMGGNTKDEIRTTKIRVELGNQSKQIDVQAPLHLIQNLFWFFGLKDFSQASHLKEPDEGRT